MTEDMNKKTEAPLAPEHATDPERNPALARRNRFLGLVLGAFVILLAVVSYYRISALSP